MNDMAIKQPADMESNEKEFSVSKKINDIEKTVSGEMVENGWIITIRKEWRDPPKDGETYREYRSEVKKYISVTNPLDNLKGKQKTDMDNAEEMLGSILGSNMLMV